MLLRHWQMTSCDLKCSETAKTPGEHWESRLRKKKAYDQDFSSTYSAFKNQCPLKCWIADWVMLEFGITLYQSSCRAGSSSLCAAMLQATVTTVCMISPYHITHGVRALYANLWPVHIATHFEEATNCVAQTYFAPNWHWWISSGPWWITCDWPGVLVVMNLSKDMWGPTGVIAWLLSSESRHWWGVL